jgi:dephospho-CoA kinase
MRNIAIFGAMYSGKTTLAAALTELGYVKVSFADPLRNIAALAYGTIDKSKMYDVAHYNESNEQISGREILQKLGEGVKQIDRDFWLKCFLRDSKRYLDQQIVLDDGRFQFELEALKENGYLTVGVDTPEEVRLSRALMVNGRYPTYIEMNHISEIEIPFVMNKVDVVIDGTGDIYREVGKVLEKARTAS